MPPRLPAPSALCASSSSSLSPSALLLRTFTSSAVVAAPPREPPHPHTTTHAPRTTPSSSSSNLLSISSNDRHRKPNHSQNMGYSKRGEAAEKMITRFQEKQRNKQSTVEQLRNHKHSADFLRQMPRRWDAGDVYSPHDLSPIEMQKWRKRSLRSNDVVDALGIRPLDMYKNFSLVQEFTTSSGQIVHSNGTSLRPVNQRKIAKMIRRVQGMGIYPTIHDHPEMIRGDFFPER